MAQPADIPRRRFGRHAEQVSILGLGGYHLGGIGSEREAIRIVHEAIDQGLTFMDCAWDYHEGRSEKRLGKALKGRYRGQKQKWFAVRFTGADGDIDIAGVRHPEFDAWTWMSAGALLERIVDFKRDIYGRVFEEFRPHLAA